MRHVTLIVAHDRQRGIGKDNKMPWHLPSELAHFKRVRPRHLGVARAYGLDLFRGEMHS